VNSLVLVPVPVSSEAVSRDSVATAEHLIGLIERQPTCLMRVGLDGVLLATNDAALSLLGATQLSQVLGTTFTERLIPAHHALWRDFADRAWNEASGSVECDLVDLSGTRRTVLVQAVALADHPDGIRSILAAVRDVSATRHLETTLQGLDQTPAAQEAADQRADETRVQLEAMRAQVDAALAERTDTARVMDALRAQLEQSIADRQRLETAADQDKAERQRLESAIEQHDADRRRLESAIEQRDADGRHLQLALDESLADRHEFESSLKQREANRQRLLAEHATARVRVESGLAEAASHNEQLTQQLADQGLDLQRTDENTRRLEALAAAGQLALDTALAARTETEQAIDALRVQLEQSKADRLRLESAIEQRDAHRRRLQSTLDESLAERQEFESAVKQRAANRQRLLAEHASARVRVESALAEAASRNEQLTQLLADQGLDLQRTGESARRLEALATAGQLALDAALAERAEASQAMDALRTQLEQSRAGRLELETAADRDKADLQRLQSAIEQRDADRRQLQSAIEQRDADRRQLQSTLDESLAERQEFESAVKQRAANRQRLLSEHATARVRVEGALAEAASRNDQLTKLLADQGLDLQRTEENARRLESLAAAGRVALEVSRELQTIIGELDARTKDLLAECPLEADEREDMEGFRSAAIRAASLARQIVQAERIP
jgi:chromosome segregation ATPase